MLSARLGDGDDDDDDDDDDDVWFLKKINFFMYFLYTRSVLNYGR